MTVNISKADRLVFSGDRVRVYWLVIDGKSKPAEKEYRKVDIAEVLAAFQAIDEAVVAGRHPLKSLLGSVKCDGIVMAEVKAPQNAERIYRLLCHRGDNWEFYVASAFSKQEQALKDKDKRRAAGRIKLSLSNGGP